MKFKMSRRENRRAKALLVYCTPREQERIKAAAKRERRTISGYVMNAVSTYMKFRSYWEVGRTTQDRKGKRDGPLGR
jgi:hypothetical protein